MPDFMIKKPVYRIQRSAWPSIPFAWCPIDRLVVEYLQNGTLDGETVSTVPTYRGFSVRYPLPPLS
jgi:hypothetical protein